MELSHVPYDAIERRIYLIRGFKVMLDMDLADLYEVGTKVLNQAVKRNLDRFPKDFMFRLTFPEAEFILSSGSRSHLVTLNSRGQNLKYAPYAFTEQGVAMLSSVLRSARAVQVNIAIMRTFVRMRELALSHGDLAEKLAILEERYDSQFQEVFEAIREIMTPEPVPARRRIGFDGAC